MFLNEYASMLNGPPGLNAAEDKYKQTIAQDQLDFVTQTIVTLFRRELRRDPTPAEIDYWFEKFMNAGILSNTPPAIQMWMDANATAIAAVPGRLQAELQQTKNDEKTHRANYSTWSNEEKQMWEPSITNVVKGLYIDNLSRNPTQQEIDYWIPVFANAGFLNDSTFANPIYQTWKDAVAPERQAQAIAAAKKQIANTLYTVVAETQVLNNASQTAQTTANAAQVAAAEAAAAQTPAAIQAAAAAQAAAAQAAADVAAQQAVVAAAQAAAAKVNPAIQTAVTQNATSYQDIVKIVDQTATTKDVAPIIATQPKTQLDVQLKPSPTDIPTTQSSIAPLVMISALAFLLGKI
jgi:hypothetical protein